MEAPPKQSASVKVFVKGKGEVTLTQAHFVAQGGQASVYQRNGTAYKIYTDPKDAIPEAKFSELSLIDDPCVVRPEELLLAGGQAAQPVGYTMRYVSDTYALCQLFPKSFRERHGFDNDAAARLVARLQEHIARVHRAGVTIVDLNELNVLVSQALDDLFLIDVDSYQTRSFRAEVIMPSVRDWSMKPEQFGELSDWFSFAVLAFQLYIGIHPYRGTHPASSALPPEKRLEHRMRHHLSAFGPEVSLPKICPPLEMIPELQRRWMRAVLEEGKRVPPPDPSGAAPPIAALPASARLFGAGLVVSEHAEFEGDIIAYAESGGSSLALTKSGFYLNGRLVMRAPPGVTVLGFNPKTNDPIALTFHDGKLSLRDVSARTTSSSPIAARQISSSGGRFYTRARDQVVELVLSQGALLPGIAVASVLEHASQLHEGCVTQSMLGSAFVSLFPRSRAGYQVRVPELDSYRIVEAKFEGRVLMVLGAKEGRYDRLVFCFDETFMVYELKVVGGVTPSGLNFIVTQAGICISVTEEEKIEAFSVARGPHVSRIVEDDAIGGDMRLVLVGGRPGYAQGNKLYTMRLA